MAAASLTECMLRVWERGAGRSTAERALIALDMLREDQPVQTMFARDAALLRLRIALVGTALDAVVACPACETAFDLSLDLAAFVQDVPPDEPVHVTIDGFSATVRPPRVEDLFALPAGVSPEAFAALLFTRCVEQPAHHGIAIAATACRQPCAPPPRSCCRSREWHAPIDVAGVLLHDIDAWAVRELDEVHRIGTACHWSEHDILELDPMRRRFYLEAIGLETGA